MKIISAFLTQFFYTHFGTLFKCVFLIANFGIIYAYFGIFFNMAYFFNTHLAVGFLLCIFLNTHFGPLAHILAQVILRCILVWFVIHTLALFSAYSLTPF